MLNPVINWRDNTLNITYQNKAITLAPKLVKTSYQPKVEFLSAFQTEQITKTKQLVYLILVAEITKWDKVPDEVKPLIIEYQDVFLNELPEGLAPSREVDFKIELLPGTQPVSRGIYLLSLKELEVLKKELD